MQGECVNVKKSTVAQKYNASSKFGMHASVKQSW